MVNNPTFGDDRATEEQQIIPGVQTLKANELPLLFREAWANELVG